MNLVLSPAYGRDYKSKKAVLDDWNNGKDFVIETFVHPDCGRYCNKQDIIRDSRVNSVELRYNKLTKLVMINTF